MPTISLFSDLPLVFRGLATYKCYFSCSFIHCFSQVQSIGCSGGRTASSKWEKAMWTPTSVIVSTQAQISALPWSSSSSTYQLLQADLRMPSVHGSCNVVTSSLFPVPLALMGFLKLGSAYLIFLFFSALRLPLQLIFLYYPHYTELPSIDSHFLTWT